MTRTVSGAFNTALLDDLTRLCRIWTINLVGGSTVRLTDLVQPITVGGQTYVPDPGMLISAIEQGIDGATQNGTADIFFQQSVITEADVRAGRLDNATFTLSLVDWSNPDGYSPIVLVSGRLTDVVFTNKGQCTVTITGALNRQLPSNAEYYSKNCRASLGDSRCTKDLTPWTVNGTILALDGTSFVTFTSAALVGIQADAFYALGTVTWTSGANTGRVDEVATYLSASGKIVLAIAPAFDLVVGDGFTIRPGCDKQPTTCKNKYANLVNYRGEPLAPPPGLTPLSLFKDPSKSSTYRSAGYDSRYDW